MSDKPAKPIFFQPSNIETIDFAMFRWLDETMNVFCNTNKGFEKVPVVWVTGERSAQLKEKDDVRDIEGTLILPRITLERKDFEKDPAFRGAVTAHHPNTGGGGPETGGRILGQISGPLERRAAAAGEHRPGADPSAQVSDCRRIRVYAGCVGAHRYIGSFTEHAG